MANWTRRRLTKTALAVVSASLVLLNTRAQEPGSGGSSGSCGNYNYYDPYDYYGCDQQQIFDGTCTSGGGGGGGGGYIY